MTKYSETAVEFIISVHIEKKILPTHKIFFSVLIVGIRKTGRASLSNLNVVWLSSHVSNSLHCEKTKGIILGHDETIADTKLVINWRNSEGIEILGIYFFNDLHLIESYNWKILTAKVKDKCQKLKYR